MAWWDAFNGVVSAAATYRLLPQQNSIAAAAAGLGWAGLGCSPCAQYLHTRTIQNINLKYLVIFASKTSKWSSFEQTNFLVRLSISWFLIDIVFWFHVDFRSSITAVFVNIIAEVTERKLHLNQLFFNVYVCSIGWQSYWDSVSLQ